MSISSFALHTPVSDKKPWKWTKTALRLCKRKVSKLRWLKIKPLQFLCRSSLPDSISGNHEYRARRIKSESPSNKLRVCFAEFSINMS